MCCIISLFYAEISPYSPQIYGSILPLLRPQFSVYIFRFLRNVGSAHLLVQQAVEKPVLDGGFLHDEADGTAN